jgi:cytochrome c oxidase subunit 2
MRKISFKVRYLLTTLSVVLLLTSCEFGPENDQNGLRPKGPAARMILDLFNGTLVLGTIIGVGIMVMIGFIGFKFRYKGEDDAPKQTHGNNKLEVIWTVIPVLILIGIAIPTISVLWKLNETPKNAIDVTVVGKQWWWQFETQTDEYKIESSAGEEKTSSTIVGANELVIPVNRKIALKVRACDGEIPSAADARDLAKANPCNVIHSFWIPSLNGKIDAVPGRTNKLTIEADQTGVYTGQCAEFCGLAHSVMRMRVRVVTQTQYDKWIKAQQEGPKEPFVDAALEPAGKAQELIQEFGCTNCHSFDDPEAVTYGPNLTHVGSRSVIGSGVYQNDFKHLWKWIYDSTDINSGVPMQSENCRAPADMEDRRCVGMPNFSIPYEYKDPATGKKVKLAAMTKDEAKTIAKYLLENK